MSFADVVEQAQKRARDMKPQPFEQAGEIRSKTLANERLDIQNKLPSTEKKPSSTTMKQQKQENVTKVESKAPVAKLASLAHFQDQFTGDDNLDDEQQDEQEHLGKREFLSHHLTKMLNALSAFFNPQAEDPSGRVIQLLGITFFAILALAGILVQVYTDNELAVTRQQMSEAIAFQSRVVFEVYDIALLLADEAEPFYELNRGPYDNFMQMAQPLMRAVDNKLIFNDLWPTDFSAIPENERGNVSSSSALRTALRNQRDARKAINGTDEGEVIEFYSTLIDNLALAAQTMTLSSNRFPGWNEYLALMHVFQAFLNLKKYVLVGRKLVRDNRTLAGYGDPVAQSILAYNVEYVESVKNALLDSPYSARQIVNLTEEQDSHKLIERYHNQYIAVLDFITLNFDDFSMVTRQQLASLQWLVTQLKNRVSRSMQVFSSSWSHGDVFSVAIFAVAGFIALCTIPVHIVGTVRLQHQIDQYYDSLELLNRALTLYYDHVPDDFIGAAKRYQIPKVRYFADTCVVVMDIMNILALTTLHEGNKMVEFMNRYFHAIEATLARYNCFKVYVDLDCFTVAAGVGERRTIDHVAEMVFAALEIRDAVVDLNVKTDEEHDINLRIGIHCGPCFARLSTSLQVPRMIIAGDVMPKATLLNAYCLPMKIQVSEYVYLRLRHAMEFDFSRRGIIDFNEADEDGQILAYWVRWADEENVDDDNYSARSVLLNELRRTTSETESRRTSITSAGSVVGDNPMSRHLNRKAERQK